MQGRDRAYSCKKKTFDKFSKCPWAYVGGKQGWKGKFGGGYVKDGGGRGDCKEYSKERLGWGISKLI